MSTAYQAPVIHHHHDRLAKDVDRIPAVADLIGGGRTEELNFALDQTCAFLNDLLIPHMETAEKVLYPELERLFQNRHSMTPMRREHDEIRSKIGEIDLLRVKGIEGPLGVTQQVKLRRALFQLYALLKIHLAEEQLYADMVEHGASPEQEAAFAAAMSHAGSPAI